MAFAETTLSSAVGLTDSSIALASATSVAAGRLIVVDDEVMQVTKDYTSGTTVSVLRGRAGSIQSAHVSGARVTHGDPVDYVMAPGQSAAFPIAGRSRRIVSFSATGTVTLPPPGQDLVVILNGTSVIGLTVPVPTKELDGAQLIILANGVAAHTVTFTGGLSDAGTSYDVLTMNGTKAAGIVVFACNETWIAPTAPAMGGTVTNLIGSIA